MGLTGVADLKLGHIDLGDVACVYKNDIVSKHHSYRNSGNSPTR